MQDQIKSIHTLSISAIVLYLLLFIPGWICAIIASVKAIRVERLKTIAIVSLILSLLTVIGGWIMMIIMCVETSEKKN